MEYVFSNKNFKESKQLGNLYYKGEVKREENYLCTFEGYTINVDENLIINSEKFYDKEVDGLFNYFFYSLAENEFYVKNDKLGKLPIYIYIYICKNIYHIK